MTANKIPLYLWLWQHGARTSLGFRLADPKLVANYDAAPKFRVDLEKAKAEMPAPQDGQTGMENFSTFMEALRKATTFSTNAQPLCEEDVRVKLRSGMIIAFGFPSPRSHQDRPVMIERHCLPDAQIPLNGKPFERGSLAFEDVRLLRRSKAEQLVQAWNTAQTPSAPTPKPPGPEGVQRRVEAAYATMKAAGEVNFDASMSAHFPALRRHLIAAHPNAEYSETRPTDETLRKTFRDLFRSDADA